MVKIKGFTLIELMIIIAIIGILASVALGPVKDRAVSNVRDANSMTRDSSAEDINNTMTINGVLHTCDADGDCSPVN